MNPESLCDFLELIKTRRSVRRFRCEKIDSELIKTVMEAVKFSPTPTNRQCFQFLAVSDPLLLKSMRQEILVKIDEISKNLSEEAATAFREYSQWFTFFDQAPVVLFGLYRIFVSRFPSGKDSGKSLEGMAEIQAFGGAVNSLLLALHAQGLAGCWMSGPLIAEEGIERILRIESPWRLGAVIPVGLPESIPPVPKKPTLDAVFSWFPPHDF